jgi:isoquinoline 1-oxidoreductase beta subunit
MNRTSKTAAGALSRRTFLTWSAAGGAGLVLGLTARGRIISAGEVRRSRAIVPLNQWISIDEAGLVTIMAARSEMGQGVRTSAPMIVADELGADWASVRVVHARPSAQFTAMRTGGSGSVIVSWRTLRPVAAAAREMLIMAASSHWGVPAADCSAEGGHVTHAPTGRRLPFGALAVRAAALPVPAAPTLKPIDQLRIVGTRVRRVDGPLIVSGRAQYGIDVRLPGMRYAAILRSPRVGGVVRAVDERAARAVPGVLEVVRVPMGIAVIADRTWSAFQGRDALVAEWDDTRAQPGGSREFLDALENALDRGKRARAEGGDVDVALRGAARRIEHTYRSPFQAHAALEPLNCTVELRADRCEIWVGTQSPNQVQNEVAKLLGFTPEQVVVNVLLMGGGFGRRLAHDYALDAAEVARAAKVNGPVQVVWSREDDMRHAIYHPGQVDRLSAALDRTGRLVAWRHRTGSYHLSQFGAYDPAYDPGADGAPWGGIDTPYAFPAMEVTQALLEAPVPTGSWRAVGYPATVFARESFMDEVAVAAGVDPLALRLSVLPSPGMVRAGSLQLPNGDRLRGVLQLAAERAGWHQPFVRERNGRRWGRGIACNAYHNQTMVAQVAEVSVGASGDVRVHRVVSAVDCGLAVNPLGLEGQFESGVLWALSAALKSEMRFERGSAATSNYTDFPVIRMNESPAVEVHIVRNDLPPMGIGEQPVPAVAPAVMNAVFHATGRRVRDLPLAGSALVREP